MYDVPYRTHDCLGMPYRHLGASGLQVPAIGLGTWKFGLSRDRRRRPQRRGGVARDPRSRRRARHDVLGHREPLQHGLGQFRAHHRHAGSNATPTAVATSCSPPRCTPAWTASPRTTRASHRLQIVEGVKASLARLDLDWIDLLWFHGFDDRTPIEEFARGGRGPRVAGRRALLRSLELQRPAARVLPRGGVEPQPTVPADRRAERAEPAHRRRPTACSTSASPRASGSVPFSPLGRGLLTDRYLDPATTGAGDRLVDEGIAVSDADRAAVARHRRARH